MITFITEKSFNAGVDDVKRTLEDVDYCITHGTSLLDVRMDILANLSTEPRKSALFFDALSGGNAPKFHPVFKPSKGDIDRFSKELVYVVRFAHSLFWEWLDIDIDTGATFLKMQMLREMLVHAKYLSYFLSHMSALACYPQNNIVLRGMLTPDARWGNVYRPLQMFGDDPAAQLSDFRLMMMAAYHKSKGGDKDYNALVFPDVYRYVSDNLLMSDGAINFAQKKS